LAAFGNALGLASRALAFAAADRICDGQQDCSSGNDEVECPRYFCKEGTSYAGRRVCDSDANCPDGEDEAHDHCHTAPTGFALRRAERARL
jgi:hypothetical protein